MTSNPETDEWVDRARAADIVAMAQSLPGAKLKRMGAEWIGPCPACGGTDRFGVNGKDRVFNCRGAGGGDVIAMVEHTLGMDFLAAVEWINGEPRPGGTAREYDPEIARERRDERRDADAIRRAQEAREAEEQRQRVVALWERRQPFQGSHAAAYLKARGIIPLPGMDCDLGFMPALPYHGYEHDDAPNAIELGSFPCMVAAIRNASGAIIGIHRTYLDRQQPRKLIVPGCRTRNKAKKIYGSAGGGLIKLGPVAPTMAIGEGIETTLAWFELSLETMGDDMGAAAAYSLGNMSGGSTDTIPHPQNPTRKISNGIPDMSRPGMRLPSEVSYLILLGDGDSDPIATRAALLTGMRRYEAEGIYTSVSCADFGKDWNDVLLEKMRAA